MPFKSKAQQRYLFSEKPDIAEKFTDHTPKSSFKKMPEHVAKDKNGLKTLSKKHRRSKNG